MGTRHQLSPKIPKCEKSRNAELVKTGNKIKP